MSTRYSSETLEAVDAIVKGLPKEWQAALIIGIFLGTGGKVWRNRKGYHARAYSFSPIALQPLLSCLGGKVFSIARGKVVWNITGKAKCLWLAKQIGKIVPGYFPTDLEPERKPAKEPEPCLHCGWTYRHDPECYPHEA